jgi:hypothetical protein
VTILVTFSVHNSYACDNDAELEDWKQLLERQIYITLYDPNILFQTLFYSRLWIHVLDMIYVPIILSFT